MVDQEHPGCIHLKQMCSHPASAYTHLSSSRIMHWTDICRSDLCRPLHSTLCNANDDTAASMRWSIKYHILVRTWH